MKIIKFAVLFFILIFFSAVLFKSGGNFETSLVKTILPSKIENAADADTVHKLAALSEKSSSIIKTAFSDDDIKDKFLEQINHEVFEINNISVSPFLAEYKKHPANFLSKEDKELLKNKQYDDVYNNALNQLYNPLSFQFADFEKEPYFLLNNFIMSNNIEKRKSGRYKTAELRIKTEKGLPQKAVNKEIEKLINLQSEFQKTGSEVYLAGAPVHSFYTAGNAENAVNFILVLSLLLICSITYFYFKSLKILIPVILSIAFGILSGFCAVKLIFHDIQLMSLVFASSLAGLGIDYSYHYFFTENRNKTFIKNLTFSMLTTIIPFLIFYLTGIELLKQTAVFSVFGLLGVYFFVIAFYPCFNIPNPRKHIKQNSKLCALMLLLITGAAIAGYFKFNFDDSLSALYKPSKQLIEAEKIYENAAGFKNAHIITVNGNSLEEILEKEEEITAGLNNYISLSRFFPSIKMQKENFTLIKELYKNNLYKFKGILSDAQINALKNQEFESAETLRLKEFFLDDNTSVIYAFDTAVQGSINIQMSLEHYLEYFRNRILNLMPYMFSGVFALLISIYGIKRGIKIFIPSSLGMAASAGLSLLFSGALNLFGIIALFLVLGFTIDYAVFKSENTAGAEDAVFVSSITTAFSFFLMSLTSFKLLSSIAFVLFTGIIVSYFAGCIIFRKRET